MSRSLKKGPYCSPKLMKKIEKKRNEVGSHGKIVINTYSRASTILPDFVGVTVMVHNGKVFIPVLITVAMVGAKLGEFSPTRTFRGHSGDKKSKDKETKKG